jgi:protein phosphatase
MKLAIEVAGQTDVGQVRANNEDNFGFDCRHGIFALSDGMGGYAAGEVASKMAVDAVLEYVAQTPILRASQLLDETSEGFSARALVLATAVRKANLAIYEAGARDPAQAGMGATVAAVLAQNEQYSIAHVGDSRIYLLRPGEALIQQLTADHSLVMEQVRRGLITAEEARTSEVQNIITRALGAKATVEPDVADLTARNSDLLLLASDGLTRHVPDDQILAIIQGAPTLQHACANLIAAANEGGGHDNITCLLLRFVPRPWYMRWRKDSRRRAPQ